jgi:hypothetical protein
LPFIAAGQTTGIRSGTGDRVKKENLGVGIPLGVFFVRCRDRAARGIGPTRALDLAPLKFFADHFVEIG